MVKGFAQIAFYVSVDMLEESYLIIMEVLIMGFCLIFGCCSELSSQIEECIVILYRGNYIHQFKFVNPKTDICQMKVDLINLKPEKEDFFLINTLAPTQCQNNQL